MIRIAICEDDCFFLEKERNLIDQYLNKIKVTHEIITFLSGKELVEHHADEFDAIFLDVAMEELDGLSVAKKFREKGTDAFIVFLTAYAEYSLEGYKVDAHRFLLKDSATMEADLAECLDSVLDKMQKTNCKVHLPVLGGDLFIDVSKIVYAESKVHKVTIHVHDKEGNLREYYMYDRLDHVQELLTQYDFLRIHQSYLINRDYLTSVCRYKAELSIGISLGISKRYYKEVEEQYIRMRGEF